MKTLTNFFNSVYNQPTTLCLRNGLKELRSQWRSSWYQSLFTNVRNLPQKIRLYATLGWIAGNEIYSNDRKFAGSVMVMVSLAFWWAHLFFDYTTVIDGWYYKNWFFWFFTNREELTIGFGLLGFFLMCPLKWGYKYALAPLIVFLFSEVVYQSFQITHWTHFYRSMFSAERGWQLLVTVPVLILSGMKVIDYVLYTKYHLKDGNICRITGMIKSPGLTPDEKMPVLDKLVDEYQNLNARI